MKTRVTSRTALYYHFANIVQWRSSSSSLEHLHFAHEMFFLRFRIWIEFANTSKFMQKGIKWGIINVLSCHIMQDSLFLFTLPYTCICKWRACILITFWLFSRLFDNIISLNKIIYNCITIIMMMNILMNIFSCVFFVCDFLQELNSSCHVEKKFS